MDVQPGDLAIVIKGLCPNIGRIVNVDRFVQSFDFAPMGLPVSPAFRVRSVSVQPLDTTGGLMMAAITPMPSLRKIDPLTPDLMRQIEVSMALADFQEALADLAKILETVELEEAVESESR